MAKIAIVVNTSWNIYNFRLPLLERLSKLGHEILVIAPEDKYTHKIPYTFHHISIKSRSVNPFNDFLIFLKFLKIFQATKPDILLLYTIKPNIYANLAASILKIKTISNITGLGTVFVKPGPIAIVAKSLYKMALKIPVKVFFQNNEDMNVFIQERLVPPHIVDRVPGSGVDLERFAYYGKSDVQPRGNKFSFLFLSRMLWEKGIGEYVQAAKLLLQQNENVEFKLLGFLDSDNPDSITKEELNGLTQVIGIEYIGTSDKVEEIINMADCVVLPSYYKEGVPRSLLEAAALAKPLITTDVTGCRDVVEDGVNGFICHPRDSQSLFEKMKKMVELDKAEREQMGINGRKKIVREFDHNMVIEKYVQTIEALLQRNSPQFSTSSGHTTLTPKSPTRPTKVKC